MNTRLKSIYWKLKKPNSLSSALKQIVAPDQVSKLEKQGLKSGEILEVIAKQNGFDSGALLMAVAELLDLAALIGNFLPDEKIFKDFDLKESLFETKNSLIFKQGDLQILLVSDLDPDLVKISNKYKLELCLGLFSQIKSAWSNSKLDLKKINEQQLREIIIVADTGIYNFSANKENYQGSLHPLITKEVLKWMSGKNKIKIKLWHEREVVFSIEKKLILINWKNIANKVLLVEDDRLFATVLKSTLEKNEYSVSVYYDAESALVAIEQGLIKPELVISDLHLPGMNGDLFLDKIRAEHLNLPFIVLTSEEQELKEVDLVLKGAGAYLKKNEDIRIILAWCRQLIMANNVN